MVKGQKSANGQLPTHIIYIPTYYLCSYQKI